MKSPIIRGALLVLLLGIAAAGAILVIFRAPELPEMKTEGGPGEAPDAIPWREPERDMHRYFPGADAHREEARVLSGARLTLIRRLGRQPTADEHLVVLHRVTRSGAPAGTVLVRRVRGTGGSIELVLAVAPGGTVRGARIQRHREPAAVASVLESPLWEKTFVGKNAASDWRGEASLPGPAREAARETVEATRSALIVLETAETEGLPAEPEAHH